MNKQYSKQSQKQPKKQYTSGAMSKLERSHAERGMKDTSSRVKHYYAIFSNGSVEDYDSTAPIFARQYFNDFAKVRGLEVKLIRAYKQK